MTTRTHKTKRISAEDCFGVVIDVQEFFLQQTNEEVRARIEPKLARFVALFGYFRMPLLVTLERPVERKGSLPEEINRQLGSQATIMQKDFFDLTKEQPIREHLANLKKKQAVLVGSETDVCVLQSCLGLIDLGFEVYVVEDLLFSSSDNVESAIQRMQAAGATLLTYKTLYYELVQTVDGARDEEFIRKYGALPPSDDHINT